MLALLGLCVSAWAACAEAADSDMQEMACCKHQHHLCGKDGAPGDCCQRETSRANQALSVAKSEPVAAPALVRSMWAALPTVVVANQTSRIHTLADASSPPIPTFGPPPYIAFSTLLI
jgi:hypothetical protein